MVIQIDLDKLKKRDLSVNEYLTMLSIYYEGRKQSINYTNRKCDYFTLSSKEYIIIDGSTVNLTQKAINTIEGSGRDYVTLALAIREVFPKGSKGGKYPWRGTVKSIVDRLKKLDKTQNLSDYSNEDILKVVNSYVNRFSLTDMDRGMQISSYFIEKDGESSLMSWLGMEEPEINSKSMEIRL